MSSFQWIHFDAVSSALIRESRRDGVSSHDAEALLRSAISRRYYAVFGTTWEWIRQHQDHRPSRWRNLRDVPGHTEMYNWLNHHPDLTLRLLGNAIWQLYRSRCVCDYTGSFPTERIDDRTFPEMADRVHNLYLEILDYMRREGYPTGSRGFLNRRVGGRVVVRYLVLLYRADTRFGKRHLQPGAKRLRIPQPLREGGVA